ncbi:LacI family DNA-binding transcriptional regulator [Devosia sp. 66-22]|uniref:LacI family DNA-binding transcriptional regulator n=1 Tax=Devosia sp. 66-22 TaxID=1895753 RepID=UPI000A80585A|nr:LacI family DNA-binding transcriptional regulator [Devosia sp. 66-22]
MVRSARQPTIVDVARDAGVAISTVSRYLNGVPTRRANRERIEIAIEQLGFRRNAMAAAMKSDRSHMIGIMAPVLDEFHSAVLERLATRLRQTGRVLVTYCHGGDTKVMHEIVDFISTQRLDGLFIAGEAPLRDRTDDLIRRGTPVIFYNNELRGLWADRVLVDNRNASRRAVNHLLDLDHTRIAIIHGSLDASSAVDRLAGYRDALEAAGVPVTSDYERDGRWLPDGGYHAMEQLMSQSRPPTALFVTNYRMTIGALAWIKERGLSVPDDLSLICFDDIEAFPLMRPAITVLSQPVEAITNSLAEMLFSRLGDPSLPPRAMTLECSLILRDSTQKLSPDAER